MKANKREEIRESVGCDPGYETYTGLICRAGFANLQFGGES